MAMRSTSRKLMPQEADIISAAKAMTESDCLAGIPAEIAERLRTENVHPMIAAVGLKDCFWVTNPYVDEPKATRATRIVTREDGMKRAIAWYLIKGGDNPSELYRNLEASMAPSNPHDGKVSYESAQA